MDAKLIEKLDTRRSNYLLWKTVGFGLFLPGIFLRGWAMASPSHAVRILFAIVAFAGTAVWLAGIVLTRFNNRRIDREPECKEALNNEMVVYYDYKAIRCAFLAMLMSAVIIYFLATWWLVGITVPSACLIVIYTAVMVRNIALLVYLKR